MSPGLLPYAMLLRTTESPSSKLDSNALEEVAQGQGLKMLCDAKTP